MKRMQLYFFGGDGAGLGDDAGDGVGVGDEVSAPAGVLSAAAAR
jgi:hypothetical protein